MKTSSLSICLILSASFAFAAGSQAFKDGSYKGSAKGHKGPIEVEVTVKDSRIDAVKILKHKENRPKKALEEIPKRIVEAQSADVDAVTGATYTSDGIKKAVEKALSKAAESTKKDSKAE